MHTSTKRILSLTVGIAFATAALSGCTSTSTPTAGSTAQSGTDEQDRLRWESERSACIEKQGFDLPEDGQVDFGSRQAEYELAAQQCDDEVGPMPGAGEELTPEVKAAQAESRAVMDKCFRDAGFSDGVGDDPEAVLFPDAPQDISDACSMAGDKAFEQALDR